MSKVSSGLVDELMKMQFAVIGLVYDRALCKVDKWYTKHTWTAKEKAKFRVQFTKRLRKLGWGLDRIASEFAMWDMAYGWRDDDVKSRKAQ